MNTGKTLFAQLMDFLPWTRFHRINARRKGDHYIRYFSAAEQLREDGVAGVAAGVLRLKPNLFALNVAQPLGAALEPQPLDVGVFKVLFALGFL